MLIRLKMDMPWFGALLHMNILPRCPIFSNVFPRFLSEQNLATSVKEKIHFENQYIVNINLHMHFYIILTTEMLSFAEICVSPFKMFSKK